MRTIVCAAWRVAAALALSAGVALGQVAAPRAVPADAAVIEIGSSHPDPIPAWVLEVDGVERPRVDTPAFTGGPFAFPVIALPAGIHAIRVGACNAFGCGWSAPVSVLAGVVPGAPATPSITIRIAITVP